MEIKVYKGFDIEFLRQLKETPLYNGPIEDKLDCFKLNRSYAHNILRSLANFLDQNPNGCAWITYEEYELSNENINPNVKRGEIRVKIIKNNLYPDIYPSTLPIKSDCLSFYRNPENIQEKASEKFLTVLDQFYSDIQQCAGQIFVRYHDLESPNSAYIEDIKDFYPNNIKEEKTSEKNSYLVEISDDLLHYLNEILKIKKDGLKKISYKLLSHNGHGKQEQLIFESFKAFLLYNGINELYKATTEEEEKSNKQYEQISEELKNVAENKLGIKDFQFRQMQFYKDPDMSKETEECSQLSIMQDIISQAEKAYRGESFRDIFMTAPTGSGKSIIFQLPAIYLAQKHHKLTLIVEPLKALQEDQKKILDKAGFKGVEYLNSDVKYISPTEKEAIQQRVRDGNTDILYVNPEMLINSSLSNLIGDRKIGLVVVDEAHTVSSWGDSFRPDYGYLGSYIKQMRSNRGNFPIFACTATAIYGGNDDTVFAIAESLYMKNPIIKLGPVRRDNIQFEIKDCDFSSKEEYNKQKALMLASYLEKWTMKNEKTIVYCPYKRIASKMNRADEGPYGDFRYLQKFKSRSALYTGSLASGAEKEEQIKRKMKAAEDFRSGKKDIMYATKAFGMGIDIPDVKNIYHYGVTGGLEDYVQEIGRCARKSKEEQGRAVIDFSNTDLQYPITLFALSKITNNQIKTCLRTILYAYNLHKINHDQWKPFYINIQAFRGTFPQAEDNDYLLSDVQRVLLMLEKDSKPMLTSKPSTLFSKWYAVIEYGHENEFDPKYFKLEHKGRCNYEVGSKGVQISDKGDVYSVNLKTMWEDKYAQNMSFRQFQFIFFNYKTTILGDEAKFISDRVRLSMETKKETLERAFQETANLLYSLCSIVKNLKTFKKSEFKDAISGYIKTHTNLNLPETTITAIANSFIEIIDKNHECFEIQEDEKGEWYIPKKGRSIDYLKEKMLRVGRNFKEGYLGPKELKDSKTKLFIGINPVKEEVNVFDYLNLMSLFDLIVFEILGGDAPAIQVRVTNPEMISRIVDDNYPYQNQRVREYLDKHYRSMKILNYFFTNSNFEKDSNRERWDFIEDYFLGEDIEKKYIQATEYKTTSEQ